MLGYKIIRSHMLPSISNAHPPIPVRISLRLSVDFAAAPPRSTTTDAACCRATSDVVHGSTMRRADSRPMRFRLPSPHHGLDSACIRSHSVPRRLHLLVKSTGAKYTNCLQRQIAKDCAFPCGWTRSRVQAPDTAVHAATTGASMSESNRERQRLLTLRSHRAVAFDT